MPESREIDVVVVGAGFAGMYMLYQLRNLGLSVQVFERGDDVGGTWYWNRYPGARCDIESMEYSYEFSDELQQEWQWTERYAAQPEILRYASHVADRFKLRQHIRFKTSVASIQYDEETHGWHVKTDRGDDLHASFCIMATGCLSSANLPDFKGLQDFKGDWYHTGRWPKADVDFTGKRVAIIGTGSSAIQTIPNLARQAERLTVFQRTANFSIPAHNAPLSQTYIDQIRGDYTGFRADNAQMHGAFGGRWRRYEDSVFDVDESERQRRFEETWNRGGFQFLSAFGDLGVNMEANKHAVAFVHRKVRAIVHDPATADLLCPDQVLGCKRLCVDSNYFETYNRDNVTLVSVQDAPIDRITETGLITGGKEYTFDSMVFATGFDAMTGSLMKIDIRGRSGRRLADKWSAGPRTYLGLQTNGFPNLFTISGPGSPSVLSNMVATIQQHVNWISSCILHMRSNQKVEIEADLAAEDAWVEHTNSVARETLYPTCNSWYLGANIPGKPRVFMPYVGGFPVYVEKCNDVVAEDYEGFLLS